MELTEALLETVESLHSPSLHPSSLTMESPLNSFSIHGKNSSSLPLDSTSRPTLSHSNFDSPMESQGQESWDEEEDEGLTPEGKFHSFNTILFVLSFFVILSNMGCTISTTPF